MQNFMVIPAIDIRNGKCVRLRRGKLAEETIYADDPVETARQWEHAGGRYLHVVDLDGAFAGRPVNTDLVIKIAAAVKIPVQTGGGLRTAEQIQNLVDHGIARVIIGTAACQSAQIVGALAEKFGAKLAVGLDAQNGLVRAKGWTAPTELKAVDLAGRLAGMGIQTLIYTDIQRDGMLSGPNFEGILEFCRAAGCSVIASGGVSGNADILKLKALALPNLTGIIVGKALYEGKVALERQS